MSNSKKIWYAPNKKEAYGDEEIQAVVDCLNDGWLAGFGPRSEEFQNKIAQLFSKKHALLVNSGSSAILLGLSILELNKDAEIITPVCTFATTLAPVIQCNLKPVFCEVEIGTYVPTPKQVCSLINDKTKVILIPNLIGSKPDWDGIRKILIEKNREDIILFEDSADTITSTPSTDISITSFYASHLITAGGTGGMLMINDDKLIKKAIMYRDWGRIGDNSEDMQDRFNSNIDGIPYDYKFLYGAIGFNMKTSEMNAAFGLIQLKKLDKIKKLRRSLIEKYIENLKDVKEIILPNDTNKFDWLAIPLMTENRVALLTYLENANIQTRVCFSGNITRHPVYRNYLQTFEVSDKIMAQGFLLGAHHGMTIKDVDYVCDKIKEYFKYNC